MSIIGTLIGGLIVGALARLVLPGKQNISILVTLALGVVGALIGYAIASGMGVGKTSGVDWIRWIISVIVAAVLIVGYGAITGRRTNA